MLADLQDRGTANIIMEKSDTLPPPTKWPDNPYQEEWAARDYLYLSKGVGEDPGHPCKLTYLLSKPFNKNFRTAIDVGCRVGEFTRYLQLDFAHVYAFDPRIWPNFRFNVDLGKVTHFRCALGDERCETVMYAGSHNEHDGLEPRTVPVYALDTFGFEDVDYIKIDVEGFEKKVLLGAAQTIERCNPVIVIEQNHVVLEGEHQYSAKEYLESIGYVSVAVDDRGWDFIMVRK
jgi:FkbM family methyltransferase